MSDIVTSIDGSISIVENPSDMRTTGSKCWSSGFVLSAYLQSKKSHRLKIDGKRCIELGAGVAALNSIVLAKQGALVLATDQEPVLNLMESNLKRNLDSSVHSFEWHELTFGETDLNTEASDGSKVFKAPYDFIVASDVIFKLDLVEPLIRTIEKLADLNTICFVASEVRDQASHDAFLELAKKLFVVKTVPKKDYKFVGEDCEFVIIWKLKLRRIKT